MSSAKNRPSESFASESTDRQLRLPFPWLFALVVSAAASLVFVLIYRMKAGPGYPLDDSWIHLAFARHLAEGHGFAINPGQASTGSTSPLWTLLLSIGYLFGEGHEKWPWVLGALCLGAAGVMSAWATFQLTRMRTEGALSVLVALGTGLLVATSPALVWSSAGAMEIALFAALLLVAWAMHMRGTMGVDPTRLSLWGIPLGLAILARPEGLLFALLLAVFSRPRAALWNLAIALLIYAPYPIFCLVVSGRPFPGTFYAKTSSAISGFPDAGYVLNSSYLLWQLATPFCVLFLAGILWRLSLALIKVGTRASNEKTGVSDTMHQTPDRVPWRALLPAFIFPFALILSYSAMGRSFLFASLPGNYGRYLYPAIPFLGIVGVWGLGNLPEGWRRQGAVGLNIARLLLLGLLVVLLAWNAISSVEHSALYAHNVQDINAMQVEMARRLARDLPPGSQVAANDVGALAYLTDLSVLDLIGIVSPEVQEALFPLRGQYRPPRETVLLRVLKTERPAVIVVFPRWFPNLLRTLERHLEKIEEIHVPDNITSGGDRLVAYRIRWPEEQMHAP